MYALTNYFIIGLVNPATSASSATIIFVGGMATLSVLVLAFLLGVDASAVMVVLWPPKNPLLI